MASHVQTSQWLSLPEFSSGRTGWLQQSRYAGWFRRCVKLLSTGILKPQRKFIIKYLKNIIMKLRIRILQWLSLLLIPQVLASWMQKNFHSNWFRRCEISLKNFRLKLHTNHRMRQINSILIKLRIWILRWLSLLLLAAGFAAWEQAGSQKTWFRRNFTWPDQKKVFSLKNIKQIIQTFNRIMEIHLRLLHWLSLLLLSQNPEWQTPNLAYVSWFRRPQKYQNLQFKFQQ